MLNINLSDFNLSSENIQKIDDHTYVVAKWNWDYELALRFQSECQKIVYENKKTEIYICTSHPHCFTMGRGLQKKQGKVIDGLIEASEAQLKQLTFPLHNIKRGGGLTFHYPGQFIFYPIINLNNSKWNLSKLINLVMESAKTVIGNNEISLKSGELMGLWFNNQKVASVGVEINRFVTMHGMALSLLKDKKMFDSLTLLNPCGLNSNTYTTVNDLFDLDLELDQFKEEFLKIFFF